MNDHTLEELDRIGAVAVELITLVHDEDPVVNGRWLASVTDERDRWAMLFMLAAAVPTDRSVSQLVAWTSPFAGYGDGRPDTPEAIARRRRDLIDERSTPEGGAPCPA